MVTTQVLQPDNRCFNTQPPEGGWVTFLKGTATDAGFNTQPPEGGWRLKPVSKRSISSFNTQPPEGGWVPRHSLFGLMLCFNTQPPEGGWFNQHCFSLTAVMFQHTAARRRLVPFIASLHSFRLFQHTAARRRLGNCYTDQGSKISGFNTQPPEGGWDKFGN